MYGGLDFGYGLVWLEHNGLAAQMPSKFEGDAVDLVHYSSYVSPIESKALKGKISCVGSIGPQFQCAVYDSRNALFISRQVEIQMLYASDTSYFKYDTFDI